MSAWRTLVRACALPGTLLALAACGGGESNSSQPPTNAPPANQAPTAQSASLTTSEDTSVSGVLAGADADGHALTFVISAQPTNGALVQTGSGFTYTPALNYHGTDQFSFFARDGSLSSAPATVTVTVTPVNDSPLIQFGTNPSEVDARSSTSFSFTASDAEGDALTTSVQQLSGSNAQANVSGNSVSILAPDPSSVETLQLRITASDATTSAVHDFSVRVLPLSASGKLRTIRGGRSAPGLHLVVTGDGYTGTEQGQLRAEARTLAATIVEATDVAEYASAWNVHVLDQESPESGVDIPSQSLVRNTAFDGMLECLGSARLLCLNFGKVLAAVVPEFPAFTQILVSSNTDLYGGSGGSIPVASRHSNAPLIALHEVGHSFAGLVDEYLDSQLDTGPIQNFNEAAIPNATAVVNPAQVKWRHWFDNPASIPTQDGAAGVGLFLGAYYRAVGYYRPTFDSFMRTLGMRMGAVNTEHWIKTIYQRGGAARSMSPAASPVYVLEGATQQFSVTPAFEAAILQPRWLENGVEIMSARGATTFACCTARVGTQSLMLRLVDVTGKVRSPSAVLERTWQIQFNSTGTAP